MNKTIPDQDAIIIASDYDIANWGLTPPNLPKELIITNPRTGEKESINDPTEADVNEFAKNKLNEKLGDHYEIIDSYHSDENGLDAIVVQNIDTGKCMVVFQGSQLTHGMQDWRDTNVALGNNQIDVQHLDALKQLESWQKQYDIEGVSGNSLAGGLVQLAVLAHPELWGRTINPAGVNEAMVLYIKDKYGMSEEELKNVDLVNFYTKTDMLHRILGIQTEQGVKNNSEEYGYLYQYGMQLFLEASGDFSLERMGVEHTGHDRVTIMGPFDPLTRNFIQGTRHIDEQTGRVSYSVPATTEIALNVEQLVDLACNLARSLDMHVDTMQKDYRYLADIVATSDQELDVRRSHSNDAIYNLLMATGGGTNLPYIFFALDNADTFSYFLSLVNPAVLPLVLTAAAAIHVKFGLDNLGVLWYQQRNVRAKINEAVENYLRECGIANKWYAEITDTGYTSMYGAATITVSNDYLTGPMEKKLRGFLHKCVQESNQLLQAMQYYSEAMLQTAQIFAAQDEVLAAKIGNTVKQAGVSIDSKKPVDVTRFAGVRELMYDSTSFVGGLEQQRKTLMEQQYHIFERLIRELLMIAEEIIPTIVAGLNKMKGADEPFESYIRKYDKESAMSGSISTEVRKSYEPSYKKYLADNQQFNEALEQMITAVERVKQIFETVDVSEVISGQFKQQLLHLLFADTELYEVMNCAQRLAAHHSICAQLVAQTNANLGYNTGTAIDTIEAMGKKVQTMAEIAESHLMRIRV